MAGVLVSNLTKSFGSTEAVKNVSLEVKSGDLVVLLGPSGCGKTTTLRCIAGLEEPDSGEIYIDGVLTNELPPKDRDVAMVFQNYALYPHMTVSMNIGFPLKMRKRPKPEVESSVRDVARLLEVQHLLNRKPRELSGGEQQRVALARAIIRKPKVFLMDEPLSNLDAKLRLYTRTEIKRLQKETGITTIYVTHDQAEAMSLADKVAIMSQGKLIQYDTPMTVYTKSATTFVAGFMGSPPMNLIRGSVKVAGSEVIFDAGSFQCPLSGSVGQVVSSQTSSGQVILGVRPEDLTLSKESSPESIFEADVYVVEPLGSNTIVDLKKDGNMMKSVIQGTLDVQAGGKVWVGFHPDRIHIYDPATQELIV